ncbi:leucine-rich repeat extensin-like protein 5 [Humulus lupulus]|uniref:leucine-rich repeat extensin-like protein 5 n=1 Tax=Humulus lupulus TaxID=3486 RepID=UPI002B40CD7B|nr:leucine-rich repeat extensin-like protein 5 [Humulus lupulus]
MPTKKAFDLYTNTTTTTTSNRKKSNPRHPGEGCSDPSAKMAQTEDPPVPTPSKEMTPSPGPADQNPPDPTDQNPPAPTDPSSPAQPDKTLPAPQLVTGCRNCPNTGILTVSTGWHRSEEIVGKHDEEIKAAEGRLAEQHKVVKAKHVMELQAAEVKITKLEEELKNKEESIAKITASKERYKEASLITIEKLKNFK